MEEKWKRPCFVKKGGGRDLMATYKIINFGKSLDAGMRAPSMGAVPVLPRESAAAGAGRDPQRAGKNCSNLTRNGLGWRLLVSPRVEYG